jgi:hypothetical protein
MENLRLIEYQDYIVREDLRQHPDKVFLFGDNLIGKGYGGQAKEMRDEPNAIGIPTKKLPSNGSDAFFSDSELEMNKHYINKAFSKIPEGKIVVIPSAGLGTGLAQLDVKAPRTYAYLLECIKKLDENNE